MPNLFGVNIAKILADNFRGKLLKGELYKIAPGTRSPGSLTGGTQPVQTAYQFEGFIDNKTERAIDGTLVSIGGRVVSILGASLPSGIVPNKGDRLSIEDANYVITEIMSRDPAAALYECAVEE